MRIGFVGLGTMGEPMAGHLAAAGNEVAVFDVNTEAVGRVAAANPAVTVSESPADLGRRSEVVITMLPDGNVVADVALGRLGLIEGMQPGTLLLDTSSAQPWLTKRTAAALAERGRHGRRSGVGSAVGRVGRRVGLHGRRARRRRRPRSAAA